MRVLSVVLAVSIVACSGSPTQPGRVQANQPFELAVGDTAVVNDSLRIRFDAVRSDSRCPMDALCVRAGEAVVGVTLSMPGEAPAGRDLDTVPPRSQATYSRFTISLSQLQPYPRSDREIHPRDYVATFIVQAR
jgi:hypothetical protein